MFGSVGSVAVVGDEVADRYRRFADVEARGISETYSGWAVGVAEDPVLLDLIRQLPKGKTQPNLVFAAARSQGAPIGGYGHFATGSSSTGRWCGR